MSMPAHPKKTYFWIRAHFYTPMTKPLGVNVPGSPSSTIPESAPLYIELPTENPFTALTSGITKATLMPLSIPQLRELVDTIRTLSEEKLSKSGTKAGLIQRILASSYKDVAVQQFLRDKEVQEQHKSERFQLKLFNSLRGGLRQAGVEILRELQLPYSLPGLPEDKLPPEAHRPGECVETGHPCLMCRVFGFLTQNSLFLNYTPPLVNDPDHKLALPQELNHVLIRMHKRNVHRPDGSTLNFNQQYFAGNFVTYLKFPAGLPDPAELGFLLHCLERCDDVGAAKAWGAGKLFPQSYTLEKVELTYEREWTGDAIQLVPKATVTPLQTELEQALSAFPQWVAQMTVPSGKADERGEIPA